MRKGGERMKAIILSAGQGKRLLPYTQNRPKCLVEISGLSILEWQLEVLYACGVEEVVVVVGYKAEMVEELLKKYRHKKPRTILNPDYAQTENIWSCWMARQEMKGPFILLNGDTLFEPGVLEKLLSTFREPITVTVNRKPYYDADDMKVILKQGRLWRVGKDLPLEEVGAESIGLIGFTPEGARLFRQYLERVTQDPAYKKKWYLCIIDLIAKEHPVGVCDITGYAWCEIDYPKDLEEALPVVERIRQVLMGQKATHAHL